MPPDSSPDVHTVDPPARTRLAVAKSALLGDFATPDGHVRSPRGRRTLGKSSAVGYGKRVIRDQPVLALGGAALIGFFLFRRDLFLRKLITMVLARLGVAAIKKAVR